MADKYKAFAPFEAEGQSYAEGEAFAPPAGWRRDEGYERLFLTKRQGGVAFVYDVETDLDDLGQDGQRIQIGPNRFKKIVDQKRVILPVDPA